MKNSDTDKAYLFNIYESSRDILDFMEGISINQFEKDKKTKLAVERSLEIIAEAVKRLQDSFKEEHPEIPWRKIIAQRNIIVHEYDKVKIDKIWEVGTRSIPELFTKIEALIPEEYHFK